MSDNLTRLRPHHGMCLAFFIGEGYSAGFSAHMARVLSSLTPKTPIELRTRPDIFCSRCPNNLSGQCADLEKVSRYDRAVLDLCGLNEGASLPFGTFTALVHSRILTPQLRPQICGDCQWNALCSAQPSRWMKRR